MCPVHLKNNRFGWLFLRSIFSPSRLRRWFMPCSAYSTVREWFFQNGTRTRIHLSFPVQIRMFLSERNKNSNPSFFPSSNSDFFQNGTRTRTIFLSLFKFGFLQNGTRTRIHLSFPILLDLSFPCSHSNICFHVVPLCPCVCVWWKKDGNFYRIGLLYVRTRKHHWMIE